MGVHDTDAYPHIKAWLDIPQDEPIFILRAQDDASVETLASYNEIASVKGAASEFSVNVGNVGNEFAEWRAKNPDKCKTPDMPITPTYQY